MGLFQDTLNMLHTQHSIFNQGVSLYHQYYRFLLPNLHPYAGSTVVIERLSLSL
eukprot:c44532_g1_i1 orf=3-161(-)